MKILLAENTASDFITARMRFVEFLANKGHEITIIVPSEKNHANNVITDYNSKITIIYLDGLSIRGLGLINKMKYAFSLFKLITHTKFDIIHLYRLQPNIIGTIIAGLFSKSKIINHITGLGSVFSSKNTKNLFLKNLTLSLYR
ncbi:MAG: hypothetical protein L7S44_07980, partial [Flavobacteriaceae bacterium]|nr:hypothetical protein [Flavobacteriaceae bacterium]